MDTQPMPKVKRPKGVWVITIYYTFSLIATLFSCYVIFSGAVPLPDEAQSFFENFEMVKIFLALMIWGCDIAGVVLLFLLRKQSFYLFACSLGFNVLMLLRNIFTQGWARVLSQDRLIGFVLGWAIAIVILWYIKQLDRKRVLQ